MFLSGVNVCHIIYLFLRLSYAVDISHFSLQLHLVQVETDDINRFSCLRLTLK